MKSESRYSNITQIMRFNLQVCQNSEKKFYYISHFSFIIPASIVDFEKRKPKIEYMSADLSDLIHLPLITPSDPFDKINPT